MVLAIVGDDVLSRAISSTDSFVVRGTAGFEGAATYIEVLVLGGLI